MSVESIRQKLTAQAADALPVFSQMPLATIDDIVKVTRFPRSRVYSAFQTLKELKLAIPVHLGWTKDKVARWHIPDEALDIVDELLGPGHHPCSRWHEDWGRSLLLPRLSLRWSRGIRWPPQTRDMGPVAEILWLVIRQPGPGGAIRAGLGGHHLERLHAEGILPTFQAQRLRQRHGGTFLRPRTRLARIDHHHRRRRVAAGTGRLGGRILRGSSPGPGVGVVCDRRRPHRSRPVSG